MWSRQVDEILSGLTTKELEAELRDMYWVRKKQFRAVRILEVVNKPMADRRRHCAYAISNRIERLKRVLNNKE